MLSPQGLKRAVSIAENDFVFLGSSHELHCTSFQAAFLSPRVHSLLQQDKTFDSLFIECQPAGIDEERIFAFIDELLNGLPVDARGSELDGLLEVIAFLGNNELLVEMVNAEGAIDKSTVCSRLKQKTVIGCPMDQEIEFAAQHFCDFDFEDLKGMNVLVLERILGSEGLRLESEDALLHFILGVDSESQPLLLRYLRSEYLSTEGMAAFLDCLEDSGQFQFPDRSIWDSLCRRLRLPVSTESSENCSIPLSRFVPSVAIPMKEDGSLNGIIAYLTQKHGGNVHKKGIVTITSKSVVNNDPEQVPTNLADLLSDSHFFSNFAPDEWVCWDFGEMRIRPTHYTIRGVHLQSWVIEGSLDSKIWRELDRQTDKQRFAENITASFSLSDMVECRFIRLTQTSHGAFSEPYLFLHAVEFFGRLSK